MQCRRGSALLSGGQRIEVGDVRQEGQVLPLPKRLQHITAVAPLRQAEDAFFYRYEYSPHLRSGSPAFTQPGGAPLAADAWEPAGAEQPAEREALLVAPLALLGLLGGARAQEIAGLPEPAAELPEQAADAFAAKPWPPPTPTS